APGWQTRPGGRMHAVALRQRETDGAGGRGRERRRAARDRRQKAVVIVRADPAVNSVEAGISEVWQMLVGGQLKVMSHLTKWLREFRRYHRDDKGTGKIVKLRRPP